ncbi:MAG: SMI1/KNR4 family protein [Bacillota bacterium]|nr:SMI1/KNR4 family protein [Bacillota bacterium]
MSYQDFERAMALAPGCPCFTTAGGRSPEQIHRAEQMLGVHFSPQLTQFYEKFGYLSFFGCEIFGIDPDSTSGDLEGNSLAYALHERSEYGLPERWIPVYNCDDGCLAFLDYSMLNREQEPRVIMCCYDGSGYQLLETLAEDFGAFLLPLVEEALES